MRRMHLSYFAIAVIVRAHVIFRSGAEASVLKGFNAHCPIILAIIIPGLGEGS